LVNNHAPRFNGGVPFVVFVLPLKVLERVRIFALFVAMLTCAAAAPARAEGLRDFCADRPGKGTPPCVLDKGHIQAEMSLIDVTRDRSPDADNDTALIGDLLIRVGVSKTTELRIGWTPIGVVNNHDLHTGLRTHSSSIGDISLGLRTSLKKPDGSGFSIAVQPSISLPTGGSAIGNGTWGASVILPMSVPLTKAIQLGLAPEFDATPDSSGRGRHARYGGVIGLGVPVSATLSTGVELAAFRDEDPAGHSIKATFDMTLAWMSKAVKDFQIDAGFYAGMNDQTPGLQIVLGLAKRF
jgi:Putative MetA-pathway of phenol degradation